MRIRFKKWPIREYGDERIVTKFLWLPVKAMTVKGEDEWRWLESAKIEQFLDYGIFIEYSWANWKWVDD